ncbi:hypothetical protein AB6N23_07425 [Cellulomonas sp. 179-A 9B4 NHS]|uniref:hypothetical protein n=1 Tax=Cellulomonas sp. 179-A 9B4 NHS TaxID=3142379 RepID=UPI0039A17D3F
MTAALEQVRRAADRVRRVVALRRPGADARPTAPHVVVRTGPAVHAVVLRGVLAAVGVVAVLVALGGPGAAEPDVGAGPEAEAAVGAGVMLLALVGVAPAVWPWSPAAALLVLGVGARVLVVGPPEAWRLASLVLLLHALLWLTALAARTGWRTRVELAVLRDAAPAALVAQAGAQVLALVATAVAGGATGGDVWRVAGAVAAALVAAVVLVRPEEPWWRREVATD